jgi:hypothetical protein
MILTSQVLFLYPRLNLFDGYQKSELPADVKAKLQVVDAAVAAAVAKSGAVMKSYLKSRFSLQQDQFPHALKF